MAGECNKRRKTHFFHENWEIDFCFTSVKDKCVCLICGVSLAVGKKCNVERHFTTCTAPSPKTFQPVAVYKKKRPRS